MARAAQLPRATGADTARCAYPLIDVGTIKPIKPIKPIQQGKIVVYPGIEEFSASGVFFSDGRQVDFDAVVLATGYRWGDDAFLEAVPDVCDEAGTPPCSGEAAPLPGRYFCGYHVAATGMLREIGWEARRIGDAIAQARVAA